MITRTAYVTLRVPDLGRAVDFATRIIGLREIERVGSASYLTCNERHHELVLLQHERPACDHLALEVAGPHELDQLRSSLAREGVSFLAERVATPGINDAFQVRAPGGHVFELFEGMDADHPPGYDTVGVRPLKFSHVALKTQDVPAMEDFLVRLLGLRVSTRVGAAVWLRCNSEHHAIALFPGRDQLHHHAWEVEGWGAIQRIGDRLSTSGGRLYFGPGRHGPGRSIFAYFRDSEGFLTEYSAEFERIDNESSYRPESFPSELEAINRWGVPPPDGFMDAGVDVLPRAAAVRSGD
jgi:catechol 2,3-dioxygenase-like lactoylglutathione lyase family enzyme